MKEEKKNKRRFGDRRDARKVRGLDGMHIIMNDIKPDRCDSDVYINQKIDVTELVKYVQRKKEEEPDKHLTYFHAFSTAIAKTIYNKPLLNRFIANRTVYDRNDVILAFVAKTEFTEEAEEMLNIVKINDDDTIDNVRETITNKVHKIRSESGKKEGVNNAIDIVASLPKFLRVMVVGVFKWLDKHGWLPKNITNDLIYYSSIILSNLGSIKCRAIYHNLTNFGTSSILLTMGEIKKEYITMEDGKQELRDMCEFGINLDERIADGLYFAKSVQLFAYILDHPELLEGKVSEKIEIK